jgi:hypothetical protein
MSLEDCMIPDSDPTMYFTVGRTMSDEVFSQHGDKVVAGLDAKHAFEAGKFWYSKRFAPHASKIIEKLSPEYAYEAGRQWLDLEFTDHTEQIRRIVASDGDFAYKALKTWSTHRLVGANNLVDVVCASSKSSERSYEAGLLWDKYRFDPYGDKFVNAVCQSPEHSYKAGNSWTLDRFDAYATDLANAVVKDAHWLKQAKILWPEGRLIHLYTIDVADEHLPVVQEAYNLSEDYSNEFFEGLQGVEPENQGKWAQHIIDNFKPKGIGGGNYREVFS